ncbi:hypothetical protein MUN78_02240 [Leucobacter allii]|uniref:Uncharacterized protein n=1 Tax=Leucobacter allii TaxID=2932247 RepID=A0ABY4FN17_9MICO|nr:hypothetical protein [Leucobacter allii]UOQ57686.1 hypothetical protein MUN78_02240 [Leucobacter allii]
MGRVRALLGRTRRRLLGLESLAGEVADLREAVEAQDRRIAELEREIVEVRSDSRRIAELRILVEDALLRTAVPDDPDQPPVSSR